MAKSSCPHCGARLNQSDPEWDAQEKRHAVIRYLIAAAAGATVALWGTILFHR